MLVFGVTESKKDCLASMFASLMESVLTLPESISPKPLPGMMSIVFVPIFLIPAKICSCEPLPRATTLMTAVIPIIMPSMVKSDLSLCASIAFTDILKLSISWSL